MKIAHVTATFPPYYSGTGMVCWHSAMGLAARGHAVTVLTADHPRVPFAYPAEIAVRRLPVAFRIGNAPLLPRLVSELKGFDVVHLHHPFIFGAELMLAAARARGIPFVLTHHNDLVGDGLRPLLFDGYSALSAPLLFRHAAKLLAVSLDHAEHCRLGPLFRRRRGDVVEIPNGVDAAAFRPGLDGGAVRRRHGVPEDAPLALFVGVLDRAHHFKGAGPLLRAFAALAHPAAVLMLVGDGDLRAAFEAEAAALGVGGRVRFVGRVANGELPPYYAAADVAVLPTAPPESFGMVLIEAMACGRPVIASNLPGVRTVVRDGVDGLLVAPGDQADLAAKLEALLGDRAAGRAMGARGRARVEATYAWDAIVPRLEAVYEEVVRDAAARRRLLRRAA